MFPYLSVVPEQASGVFETTPSFTAKTGRRVLLSLFLLLLTHKMAPTSRVSSTAGRKIHHHDQLQKGLACDCWCVPPLLDLGASSPTDGLRGQSSSQGSLHGGDSCLQCLLANGKVRGQSGGGLRLSLLGQDEGEESQAEGSQDRGACGDATGYANLQTTVAFSLGSSLTLTFRRVNEEKRNDELPLLPPSLSLRGVSVALPTRGLLRRRRIVPVGRSGLDNLRLPSLFRLLLHFRLSVHLLRLLAALILLHTLLLLFATPDSRPLHCTSRTQLRIATDLRRAIPRLQPLPLVPRRRLPLLFRPLPTPTHSRRTPSRIPHPPPRPRHPRSPHHRQLPPLVAMERPRRAREVPCRYERGSTWLGQRGLGR